MEKKSLEKRFTLLKYTFKKMPLIYKEIQKGLGAKSYMRKDFLIYEKMRKYLTIYEEAVSHMYITLHPIPSEFPYI
jgi:histidinol phosphatase-like enzyme